MPLRPATVQRREEILRDALALMQRECHTDLELPDVARRVASSRRQVQRAFTELYGASFRTALCRIRMRKAAELLGLEEALTVREVAARVGYRQPAQFAKAFQRELGMTPSAFREQRLGLPGPRRGRVQRSERPAPSVHGAARPVDAFWQLA
jgi:AraC family transcriptional regulator, regulatory protein of adaptative response / methylphosphotriester-DNA alkyltransferase methyltransferase